MVMFSTRISGIPCQVEVHCISAPVPARTFGYAFEDSSPDEPGEYEIEVYDRKGYKAAWLARKMSDKDFDRLIEEASAAYLAEGYDIDF